MEKNNNESFIAYIRRVTNACSNKQLTYTEWGDYLLGEENVYTEDNCRKGYYIVKKLLCKIDESVEITDDELMKQLESIKDEIYKERVKLQDVQREKRKKLRVDARFENLLDVLKKEIEKLQNQYENRFVNALASIDGIADNLATFYLLYGDVNLINTENSMYQSITAEEIREVAKKYLNPNQRVILDYIPTKEKAQN